MKKIWILMILFSLMTPALAAKADDATGRDDTQVFHMYEDVDLVSTLKFEYGIPRIVVKSVYPQLESDTIKEGVDTFNQVVIDLVQTKIAEYKKQVLENQALQQDIPKEKLKNTFYLDYATSFIQSGKNPIISVRFSSQGYITGMAHPYHHYFVLNYDLNNNEQLDLSDLFSPDADYLTVLSNYTSTILFRRLPVKDMIAAGTAPLSDNFKNWNIKPNGLLITFSEAEVAPAIYGTQTVLVPFSVLKPLIDRDSPIAGCVLHKKRCVRGNLLTGGFIDEARNLRTINPNHGLLNPTLSKL